MRNANPTPAAPILAGYLVGDDFLFVCFECWSPTHDLGRENLCYLPDGTTQPVLMSVWNATGRLTLAGPEPNPMLTVPACTWCRASGCAADNRSRQSVVTAPAPLPPDSVAFVHEETVRHLCERCAFLLFPNLFEDDGSGCRPGLTEIDLSGETEDVACDECGGDFAPETFPADERERFGADS